MSASILLIVFLALGSWQWRRAEWKSEVLAEHAAATQATPVELGQVELDGAARYRRVVAHGQYSDPRVYLLDNQIRDGRPGVLAFSAFRVDGLASDVLIGLGWLPWSADRRVLPAVPQRESGKLRLLGGLAPAPASGIRLGDNALARQTGPVKLLSYFDRDEIAADLGRPLAAPVLQLEPAADSGFLRDWQPTWLPPERHRGYAVQWWALAAAVVIVFGVLHRPK